MTNRTTALIDITSRKTEQVQPPSGSDLFLRLLDLIEEEVIDLNEMIEDKFHKGRSTSYLAGKANAYDNILNFLKTNGVFHKTKPVEGLDKDF